MVLDADDIDIGTYEDGTFTVTNTDPDAIRVRARRSDLRLFLAPIFGRDSTDVTATSIAMMSTIGSGRYPCVMFSNDSPEFNGNGNVSGYDSTVSLTPLSAPDDASVCTNADSLQTQGNYYPDADAHPGPGGTTQESGHSEITGDTSPLPETVVLPRYDMPTSGYVDLGDVELQARQNLVLSCGTTYVVSKFKVSGQATVTIPSTCTQPVTIFSDGEVDINGGGMVNQTRDPHMMIFHQVGTNSWHNNGNSAFYGTVTAPDSEIELNGTADVFGAFIGDLVHHNGDCNVYLDTSLVEDLGTDVTTTSTRTRLVQ